MATGKNDNFVLVGNPNDRQSGGLGFGSEPDFALYIDQDLEMGSSGQVNVESHTKPKV